MIIFTSNSCVFFRCDSDNDLDINSIYLPLPIFPNAGAKLGVKMVQECRVSRVLLNNFVILLLLMGLV